MHQFTVMPITFILMKFIYAFSGLITLGLIITLIINKRNTRKFIKAQKLYHKTKNCGHHSSDKWEFFAPTLRTEIDVKSTTNKLCKVCGKFQNPKELVNDEWG